MTTPLFELLLAADGSDALRVPVADGTSILVGRDATCDVSLAGETKASRHHCRIWCEGGVVRVRDLDSSNGTRLAGERLVAVAEWTSGQPLEVGLTRLDLVAPGAPAPVATSGGKTGGNGAASPAAAADVSPWRLRRRDNDDVIQPPLGATTIGRLPECDVTLEVKGISAGHARLHATPTSLEVEDLGSSNGTFVDGERLDPNVRVALIPTSRLKLGNIGFVIDCEGHTAPIAAAVVAKIEQAATPFVLEGRSEPIEGASFPVGAGARTVGRGDQCTWQIDHKSVSTEHARLEASAEPPSLEVVDLGSSNGTFVNGERLEKGKPVVLDHGSRLRFGAVKLSVQRTDREVAPAPPSSSAQLPVADVDMPIPLPTLIRAGALTLVVAACIVGAAKFIEASKQRPGDGSGVVVSTGGDGSEVLDSAEAEEAIRKALLRSDYQAARAEIAKAGGQVNQKLVALTDRHARLKSALRARLVRISEDNAMVTVFGFANTQVVRVDHREVEIFRRGGSDPGLKSLYWKELSPAEMALAYREQALHRQRPLDYASYIAFHGEKALALEVIQRALREDDATKADVVAMADELGWRLQPHELAVTRPAGTGSGSHTGEGSGSGIGSGEGSGSGSGDGSGSEVEPPRIDEEAARKRELEAEMEREAGEVVSLGRLLRYSDAIASLERLLQDSPTKRLTRKLQGELKILRLEAALFARTREAINTDGIDLSRVPSLRGSAGADAKLAKADEEFYTIALTRGELRERWRYLGVKRMIEVYRTLPRTEENLLARGIFAYERGQLSAANRALIAAKNKSAALSRRVDEYLAFRIGISVPKEGFVPYNGRLVTPEEQAMRKKGLVRYGDEWVTPEDKAKLESGMVRYKGKWVAAAEAELLKQGYVKYEGKWHKKADLNKIRSAWDKAWELETAHVQLRSNMDIDFVEELLLRLEGSYHRYKQYWGKAPNSPLRFFAFRTFEDYQKYCLDNKYNNLLGAAGFALPHKNICVGYNKGNNKNSFYGTMVHEASHLFYGRVHRAQYPSWYAEAMSTFHEAHEWVDPKKKKVLRTGIWNRSRYYGLRWSLRDGNFIPYAEMFVTNALTSINTSRARANAFYTQAWALYYYLEVGCKKTRPELHEKWKAFHKSVDEGGLNGRGGRGGGLNNAAKAKFEAEVMTCAQLDAAVKEFFSNPANVPGKKKADDKGKNGKNGNNGQKGQKKGKK